MDWMTVATATGSAMVSGGLIGGVVSYLVAGRESKDRQAAIQLERDKWEHEKGADHRKRSTAAIADALACLESFRVAIEQLDSSERDDRIEPLEAIESLMESSSPLSMRLAFSGFIDSADRFDEAFIVGADFVQLPTATTDPDMDPFQTAYLMALRQLHDDLKSL